MACNSNLYSANIDVNELQMPKHALKQRVGLSKRASKDQKKVIMAEQPVVDETSFDQLDSELIKSIDSYLDDFINHAYNPWVEQLYAHIIPCQTEIEENDSFHLFKIQSFILDVVKLKAQNRHNIEQQSKNEKAKKERQSGARS